VPKQAGNNHPTSIPTGVFPTADGHINIAASGTVLFERFCKALGVPEWIEDPRFNSFDTRKQNRDELNEKIGEVTSTKPSQYWVDLLNETGVPCGPIYNMKQVFDDPQVKHLGIATPMESPALGTVNIVGQPIVMERTPQPKKMRLPTPELGEHTDAILSDLGYSKDKIDALRAQDVI
jgi:crotonobetainyl-CoA:carnitine CoA-transferase CaiB-like acyl-CoA transferase